MDTMANVGTAADARIADADRAWARVGRAAGYAAGIGFLAVTVLYLLDVFDLLDPTPTFVSTGAGPLHDEAVFWVAVFAHEHRILWDVIARDLLGPAAYVALVVVAVALRRRVGGERPEPSLMVAFLAVGAVISAIASLLYLGNAELWRHAGAGNVRGAEVGIVAVGRATAAINALTTWPEAFGYLVLGLGVWCLGRIARGEPGLPGRLGTLAYVLAGGLVALACATALDTDTPRSILSLAVGAVMAPWISIWLARVLGHDAEGS